MRNLVKRYPWSTVYIVVMVTLIFLLQIWEVTGYDR